MQTCHTAISHQTTPTQEQIPHNQHLLCKACKPALASSYRLVGAVMREPPHPTSRQPPAGTQSFPLCIPHSTPATLMQALLLLQWRAPTPAGCHSPTSLAFICHPSHRPYLLAGLQAAALASVYLLSTQLPVMHHPALRTPLHCPLTQQEQHHQQQEQEMVWEEEGRGVLE